MKDFEGKVAVITGAGRGMGRGIAYHCAKKGMKIVLADIRLDAIRDHAKKLVPVTEQLQIMTHFAGLRPIPGDGLPILGGIERNPGLYVAVGHSGITLSPIHGRVISDLIVEGETSYPIEAYDPLRFERAATVENKMAKEL